MALITLNSTPAIGDIIGGIQVTEVTKKGEVYGVTGALPAEEIAALKAHFESDSKGFIFRPGTVFAKVKKATNARFKQGSGTYCCHICQKQTRDTGRGETSVELCALCMYECELENACADYGFGSDEYNQAEARLNDYKREVGLLPAAPKHALTDADLPPGYLEPVSKKEAAPSKYSELTTTFFRGKFDGQLNSVYKTLAANPKKAQQFLQALIAGDCGPDGNTITKAQERKLKAIGWTEPHYEVK